MAPGFADVIGEADAMTPSQSEQGILSMASKLVGPGLRLQCKGYRFSCTSEQWKWDFRTQSPPWLCSFETCTQNRELETPAPCGQQFEVGGFTCRFFNGAHKSIRNTHVFIRQNNFKQLFYSREPRKSGAGEFSTRVHLRNQQHCGTTLRNASTASP